MTINRLGPIDPVSRYNKTGKTSKASKQEKTDSINVSAEARSKAEIYKTMESIKAAEDIRMDRVEEVKRKLEDPSYISDKVVESVADSLMDVFGL